MQWKIGILLRTIWNRKCGPKSQSSCGVSSSWSLLFDCPGFLFRETQTEGVMISLIFLIFSAAVAVGIYKALSSATIQDENNRVLSPDIRTVLNRTMDLCSPVRTTRSSPARRSSSPSTSNVQSDLDKTVDLWACEELNNQLSPVSKDSPWTHLKTQSPTSPYGQDDLNRTVGLGSAFLPKTNVTPDKRDSLFGRNGFPSVNRTEGTSFVPENHASQDVQSDLNRTVAPFSPVEAESPYSTWRSTARSTRCVSASRIPQRIRVHLQFEDTAPPSPKPQRVDARDLILEIQSPCTLLAQAVRQKYFPNTPPPDEEISEEEDDEIRRLRSLVFKKRPSQVLRESRATIRDVKQMIADSRMRRMLREICRKKSAQ